MATIYYIYCLLLLCGCSKVASRYYNRDGILQNNENILQDAGIIGGLQASEGQFPYQVYIRMMTGAGELVTCGGSIIDNHWVITAAQCLAHKVSSTILFGVTNVNRPTETRDSDDTSDFFINPSYFEPQGGVQTHDIGLLRVKVSVPYGSTIQPIRLQSSSDRLVNYDGISFTASGFDFTVIPANGAQSSEDLFWVHQRGISLEECRRRHNYNFIIQNVQICAESYDTSQAVCRSDPGGPLVVVDNDGRNSLVGILSYGSADNCVNNATSVYVRPGFYLDWMSDETGLDLDWTSGGITPPPEPEIVPPSSTDTDPPTTDLEIVSTTAVPSTTPENYASKTFNHWLLCHFIVTILVLLR